jgi:glutathione S-transferase
MTFPKHNLAALSILSALESEAPNFYKWANAVVAEKSVTCIWDEQRTIETSKAKVAKVHAQQAAQAAAATTNSAAK